MAGQTLVKYARMGRRLFPTRTPPSPGPTSPVSGERGILSLILPEGWPASANTIEWEWKGASRTDNGSAQKLSDVPSWTANSQIIVWSPAQDTRLARVHLPSVARGKIEQALPFALEDELLDEPETLSFAYEAVGEDLAVAITARERIRTWLSTLREAGLEPVVVCPKPLRLPLDEKSWTLWFSEGLCFVRSGQRAGFVCETSPDFPCPVLATAINDARRMEQTPSQILIYNPPRGFRIAVWSESLGIPVRLAAVESPSEPSSAPPINLMQGEWAPAATWHRAWIPFRPTLAVLALWLATGFLFNLWQCIHLSWVQKRQHAQMTTLFRQTFPEAKAIVDPALQMERNVLALKTQSGELSDGDFLALLTSLVPAWRSAPQVRPRSLQYDENGVTLELLSPDFKTLENLKNHWSVGGRRAEILSAENRDGHVEGRLRIQTEAL